MHEVVPAEEHEETWLLVQFTYWPQPDGLPEPGDAGELLSLVQLVIDAGVVPSREMMNPMQYPALAAEG